MKKRKWILWIAALIVSGVAVWLLFFRNKEPAVVLQTEKPFYGSIASSITATGTIQPIDTVSVGTQVSGTISAIYVDFNEKVKKGQLLAELDKSLLQAQVDQARAAVQQAQSNLNYQQSNYERQKQLLEVGAVSRAEYEVALNQFQVAKDNLSSATSQLRAAERNLSYASIYSPIDGIVLTRNVSIGQTVAASFSTPTLFVIARDLTRMQVQASVDEADIGNVRAGQRVSFTVDAFPGETFEGTVHEIRLRPSISANVVTYTTLVNAPNEDMRLKPGMTANITVYTREEENALLIPAGALRFRPDSSLLKDYIIESCDNTTIANTSSGHSASEIAAGNARHRENDTVRPVEPEPAMAVVWVKKDSVLSRRVIQTGLTDNINVQVLSGLTTNDIVVTGVQQTAGGGNTNARSPFMPQRRRGG